MARSSDLFRVVRYAEREIARSRRDAERAQNAVVREHQRSVREAERAAKAAKVAAEKQSKKAYQAVRESNAARLNVEIERKIDSMQGLLRDGLAVDSHVNLDDLKEKPKPPKFNPGGLAEPKSLPSRPLPPFPPRGLARLSKKRTAAYEEAVLANDAEYEQRLVKHKESEEQREKELDAAHSKHQALVAREHARVAEQHEEVEAFALELEAADAWAVGDYFELVLRSSTYPDGFPTHRHVAYLPESRQLVVEADLPTVEAVPKVRAYRHIKTRDEIVDSARPAAEIRRLYADLIAQMAVRTLHEIFEADRGRWVDTVVLNGHVDTVDPGTGHDVHPCLLSVRTMRETFLELNLDRVEATACLRSLGAAVSKKPIDLVSVAPIVEFSTVALPSVDG